MSAEHRDGMELLQRLMMLGSLMPSSEELEEYAKACHREDAVGPLFYPDVHRRAAKRLPASAELAKAGARYVRAFEAMKAAVLEEADPEMDAAARTLHDGMLRKMRASEERGR